MKWKLRIASIFLSITPACRDAPAPPSQDAVDQAWKRSDQAVDKAAEAEVQVRHLRRLRDLDRLRYDTETAELTAAVWWLRGLAALLVFGLLSVMIWLAIEIRRRRVLSAVVIRLGGLPSQHIEGPDVRIPLAPAPMRSGEDWHRGNGRDTRFSSHPVEYPSYGGYDNGWGQPRTGSSVSGISGHDGLGRFDLAPNGTGQLGRSGYADPFWDTPHHYAGPSAASPSSPSHPHTDPRSPLYNHHPL